MCSMTVHTWSSNMGTYVARILHLHSVYMYIHCIQQTWCMMYLFYLHAVVLMHAQDGYIYTWLCMCRNLAWFLQCLTVLAEIDFHSRALASRVLCHWALIDQSCPLCHNNVSSALRQSVHHGFDAFYALSCPDCLGLNPCHVGAFWAWVSPVGDVAAVGVIGEKMGVTMSDCSIICRGGVCSIGYDAVSSGTASSGLAWLRVHRWALGIHFLHIYICMNRCIKNLRYIIYLFFFYRINYIVIYSIHYRTPCTSASCRRSTPSWALVGAGSSNQMQVAQGQLLIYI